jgi:hypothetical protein
VASGAHGRHRRTRRGDRRRHPLADARGFAQWQAAHRLLLIGRRPVYDWFVVGFLVAVAVWHAVALFLLQSFPETELRLTVLAWVPTFAFLAMAGCTAVASINRRRGFPDVHIGGQGAGGRRYR